MEERTHLNHFLTKYFPQKLGTLTLSSRLPQWVRDYFHESYIVCHKFSNTVEPVIQIMMFLAIASTPNKFQRSKIMHKF